MAYKIKQTRKSITIQVTFILFIFIFAIYNFLQSDFFMLRDICIRGNKNLNRGDILNVINIKTGSNIFHLNLNQASQNIEFLPTVKKVIILRKLPGTIIIDIEERDHFAVIPYENSFKIIDKDFFIIKSVDKISNLNLPLVTGINAAENLQNGDRIELKNKEIILMIVDIIWEEAGVYFSEINISENNSINMYTHEGIKVHFGNVDNIEDKFTLFKSIYSEKTKENILDNIKYIDVSFKGRPVIKYN